MSAWLAACGLFGTIAVGSWLYVKGWEYLKK